MACESGTREAMKPCCYVGMVAIGVDVSSLAKV